MLHLVHFGCCKEMSFWYDLYQNEVYVGPFFGFLLFFLWSPRTLYSLPARHSAPHERASCRCQNFRGVSILVLFCLSNLFRISQQFLHIYFGTPRRIILWTNVPHISKLICNSFFIANVCYLVLMNLAQVRQHRSILSTWKSSVPTLQVILLQL